MMDNENRVTGIMYMSVGFMMIFMSFVLQGVSEPNSDEYSQLADNFKALGDINGILNKAMIVLGIIIILMGIVRLAIGFMEFGNSASAFDDKENVLIFRILDGKKKKEIRVSMDKLSNNARLALRKKIETPLEKLYLAAYKGKRSKEEYKMCKDYISSVAHDLENAVNQCENELMEKKLLEKLYIIENAIEKIIKKVEDAILTDKDEKQILKELQAESFDPFLSTENMNKLY